MPTSFAQPPKAQSYNKKTSIYLRLTLPLYSCAMDRGLRTRIVNLIKKSDNKSLSVSEIFGILSPKFPMLTKNQIKKVLVEIVAIDEQRKKNGQPLKYAIVPNRGGNAFRFTAGGEITRKGTGPYRDIANVLDGDSKNICAIFGAPHLNSFDVHAGKSARGKWGRPDIIVALYRSVGSSRPFSLHAIEYEGQGGFSPANVAQAYFGGSGADKCWLLFDSRDWPKNATQRRENPGAERVRAFAKKLGVGLIYYRNLARSSEWVLLEPAINLKRNPQERETLRQLFEGEIKKMKKSGNAPKKK